MAILKEEKRKLICENDLFDEKNRQFNIGLNESDERIQIFIDKQERLTLQKKDKLLKIKKTKEKSQESIAKYLGIENAKLNRNQIHEIQNIRLMNKLYRQTELRT